MNMSGPDREGRAIRGLDGRLLWRRIAAFILHALCSWSCLSAAGPFVSLTLDSETANAPADLDSQFEEILNCVWRQERIWRLEQRIQASLGHQPRTEPPSSGQIARDDA